MSDGQLAFLKLYEKSIRKMRPGDVGEIQLEPWMGNKSSRARIRTLAERYGLSVVFGRSSDPRKLVFRVESLPRDSRPVDTPRPPLRQALQRSRRVKQYTTVRSYTFDLSPYREALQGAADGVTLHFRLGKADPKVIRYRMNIAAKQLGLRLIYKEPARGRLPFTVSLR